MKIFITGVTGLVGGYIARNLLAQQHQIIALCRSTSNFEDILDIKNQIEWIKGDLHDLDALAQGIKGADYVIHASALVSFSPKDKAELYHTNVEGTKNIVNTCLDFGTKKMLFVSSIASLGRIKGITNITEKQKWEDSPLNSHYAKSKYLAEMEIWRAYAEGLDVVVVNPSIILGVGDWTKSSTQIFHYAQKKALFYPKGSISYVDVRDVADFSIKLLFSGISGEKFILNSGKILYKDFFEKIAQKWQIKPPKYQLPDWIAQIAWRVLHIWGMISGSKPVITKETIQSSAMDLNYDNSKICQKLQVSFKSLENTLDWACEEFKDKYKI
jgi:dihydroflavonol-4-reductase